ncbi:MAG: nucleotidyltransferase family protein [Proteobacteria bacterium]|nr:nucleotidyltransferase family protein [Pseudomonadota bacterium]
MRVMILAAGKGERMRPLTLVKPKPLLEVCGTTLIEHHIINLKKTGFDDIVINVCWLAQQIMAKLGNGSQYGVKIRYSAESPEPLETGGGMFNALPLLGEEPFMVVNADIKTDFDFGLLRNIELKDKLAHLVLVTNPTHNPKGDFAISDNYCLSHEPIEDRFTYSGIGIYHPKLFDTSSAGRFSVVPLLKNNMRKHLISGQLYKGQWNDIGCIERLIEINKNCKK